MADKTDTEIGTAIDSISTGGANTAADMRGVLDDLNDSKINSDEIGTSVQGYDADTLKADTADQLTAGFTSAVDDDGTQSTGTYTPAVATGNYKKIVNGGAFTLAPPSPANNEAISMNLFITNNASAGAITTTGFTKVSGDSFDTTDGNDFLCRIEVYDIGGTEYSLLQVVAMQ